jgi:hypothetical protein
MTATEIKTAIDLEITDVVALEGVTNANVGARMKDLVDFTTQEIASTQNLIPTVPLEWSAQIYQAGTSDPAPQVKQVSTLLVNDIFGSPTDFRDVDFERVALGEYFVMVRFAGAGNTIDFGKAQLLFGDSSVRITSVTSGAQGGYTYRKWTFKTYTPNGTQADDQLLGNNGMFLSIRVWE